MQLKFQKFSAEGPSPSQNSPTGKGGYPATPHLLGASILAPLMLPTFNHLQLEA